MISKNTTKLIKSLTHKKFRQQEKLFIVEGDKIVSETLTSNYKIVHLFATSEYISKNSIIVGNAKQVSEVAKSEINKISQLKSPQNSFALCYLPDEISLPNKLEGLTIFLDEIQDPGNLGTIIRICDWFGISQLFCSPDTVDVYNPKVIQATMGSFCRIQIHKAPFDKVQQLTKKTNIQIMGAFMEGENIYKMDLPQNALIVMGNEGNGIRLELEKLIDKRISIPQFSKGAESLNVAIATSIICSEFRRDLMQDITQNETRV